MHSTASYMRCCECARIKASLMVAPCAALVAAVAAVQQPPCVMQGDFSLINRRSAENGMFEVRRTETFTIIL
jgi:hypothetical protein